MDKASNQQAKTLKKTNSAMNKGARKGVKATLDGIAKAKSAAHKAGKAGTGAQKKIKTIAKKQIKKTAKTVKKQVKKTAKKSAAKKTVTKKSTAKKSTAKDSKAGGKKEV